MVYVFIDTNIYLRVISQGKDGCERSYFDNLALLVKAGEICLLAPEVVELEIEAKWRRFINQMVDEIAKQIKQLEDARWESEVDDVRISGIKHFQSEVEKKKKNAKVNHAAVMQLLTHAVRIPLTSEIVLSAKKRQISQKMPRKGNSSDQDALIIESLAAYFSRHAGSGCVLYFCSENSKDFADEPVDAKSPKIHSLLRGALPESVYCRNLEQTMAFDMSYYTLKLPVVDWKELEAARKEQEGLLEQIFDLEVKGLPCDELQKRLLAIRARNNDLRVGFEAQHAQYWEQLPEYIRRRRKDLVAEIDRLFSLFRQHPKYSPITELNLPHYIGGYYEIYYSCSSFSALVKIRDGMRALIHNQDSGG